MKKVFIFTFFEDKYIVACGGIKPYLQSQIGLSPTIKIRIAQALGAKLLWRRFPMNSRMTLTREDVEGACVGVASGISLACEEALLAAGMAAGDVQDVELLGGGSYIPALRRPVETVFG